MCQLIVGKGPHKDNVPLASTQENPEPSLENTSATRSMAISVTRSSDGNKINLDFVLHTSSTDEELSSNENQEDDIRPTTGRHGKMYSFPVSHIFNSKNNFRLHR